MYAYSHTVIPLSIDLKTCFLLSNKSCNANFHTKWCAFQQIYRTRTDGDTILSYRSSIHLKEPVALGIKSLEIRFDILLYTFKENEMSTCFKFWAEDT